LLVGRFLLYYPIRAIIFVLNLLFCHTEIRNSRKRHHTDVNLIAAEFVLCGLIKSLLKTVETTVKPLSPPICFG